MKLLTPIRISVSVLIIFNVLALSFNWYHTRPWVDIPSHIVFGVLIGLLILSFHPRLKSFEQLGLVVVLQILFLGLAAGSLWEIIEYTRDAIYALPRHILLAQQSTHDTFGDIGNNMLGVGAVMLVYKLRMEKKLKFSNAGSGKQ